MSEIALDSSRLASTAAVARRIHKSRAIAAVSIFVRFKSQRFMPPLLSYPSIIP